MASSSWERRNERARELGYRNYYDYRVHDNGNVPPSEPASSGADLRRQRGHASFQDLMDQLDRPTWQVLPMGLERGPDGRYERVLITILTPGENGRQIDFYLRGRQASQANLQALKDRLDSEGIGYIAAPSIDVFAGGMQAAA